MAAVATADDHTFLPRCTGSFLDTASRNPSSVQHAFSSVPAYFTQASFHVPMDRNTASVLAVQLVERQIRNPPPCCKTNFTPPARSARFAIQRASWATGIRKRSASQYAAGSRVGFVHVHIVAQQGHVESASQAGRARAHHRDLLPVGARLLGHDALDHAGYCPDW